MSTAMKTPGVYIQEKDAFGNSVVPVPTAVPAFIGYTEKTSFNGKSLLNKPVRITSLSEYLAIFGGTAPRVKYGVVAADGGGEGEDGGGGAAEPDVIIEEKGYAIQPTTLNYRMFSAMKFFYQNGGGDCYIVSIGSYTAQDKEISSTDPMLAAIDLLKKESEPTLLVIPDVVELDDADAYSVQGAMVKHCAGMMNRFAILDVPSGYQEAAPGDPSAVDNFRSGMDPGSAKNLSYCASYYPWVHTTMYQPSEISFRNIDDDSLATVNTMLTDEFTVDGNVDEELKGLIDTLTDGSKSADERDNADLIVQNVSPIYKMILGTIRQHMNLMAPSSAMAGVYTAVDNSQGVFIAPANVGLIGVISPAINIDHEAQEDLNMPLNGKSVCAIRAFTGEGIKVWGARTMDGNSNDWRYVNVRRTLIYLEESVKNAAKAYVFAPNDAGTWISVKSMIANFLTNFWNQGGLVGPTTDSAFEVHVGLGSTMTADDVLNGIMRVSVKVAVSRPAEFIEITFQQKMQEA